MSPFLLYAAARCRVAPSDVVNERLKLNAALAKPHGFPFAVRPYWTNSVLIMNFGNSGRPPLQTGASCS
jgi:hypothetical protein